MSPIAAKGLAPTAGAGAPPLKRARVAPARGSVGAEEQATEAAAAPSGWRVPGPDELEEGTPVLYWGTCHGLVNDAYQPLDEFWVAEAETGKIVRGRDGQIAQFRAADLLVLTTGAADASAAGGPACVDADADADVVEVSPAAGESSARDAVVGGDAPATSGVLVIGSEAHMVEILKHFGPAQAKARKDPQQLLAIPCNMCHPEQLSGAAAEGVAEEVLELGRSLRPDIFVGVRALQIKQAVERIGAELLVLEGFYALLSVQAPYSLKSCDGPELTEFERRRRRDFCNQVDLCITARGQRSGDESHDFTMRRALGEACGMELADTIWRADTQTELRRRIGVPELVRGFTDASGAEVDIILLPEDAPGKVNRGVLSFGEGWAPSSSTAAATASAGRSGGDGAAGAGGGGGRAAAVEGSIQGRTIREWEASQAAEFADLPPLPPGWLRVKSRTSGEVYFFNRKTMESTFEMPKAPEAPLPAGWTKHVSKSTNKTYYFHAQRRLSQFERPAA